MGSAQQKACSHDPLGLTLDRDRLPQIDFHGETLDLPIAPLTVASAGSDCLDHIGDYQQSLPRP